MSRSISVDPVHRQASSVEHGIYMDRAFVASAGTARSSRQGCAEGNVRRRRCIEDRIVEENGVACQWRTRFDECNFSQPSGAGIGIEQSLERMLTAFGRDARRGASFKTYFQSIDIFAGN